MAEDNGIGSGILWFMAGLGLGAALGVLYAPKAGRETRDMIWDAAEEGGDALRERARRYRDQASQWVDRGKEAVTQQKEQLRNAFEAGRQAYRESSEAAATKAEHSKP